MTTQPLPALPLPAPTRSTCADVAYAFMLLQAAFGIVATLGVLLLMAGSLAHAVVPLLFVAALLVVAGNVARRRRWALIAALVIESAGIGGLMIDVVLGLLGPIDYNPTLTGLLTTVVLPVLVIVLCTRSLIDDAR